MERSSKRKATEQLNTDNFNKEEPEEEEEQPTKVGGTWQRAPDEILQKRKVVKAKRKGLKDTPPKEASTGPQTEQTSKGPSIVDKLPTFWSFSSPTEEVSLTVAEKKEEASLTVAEKKVAPASNELKWNFGTSSAAPETASSEKKEGATASTDYKWSFGTSSTTSSEKKEGASASTDFKWSFSPTPTLPSFAPQKFDYVPPAASSSVTKWPSFSVSENFSFGSSSAMWPSFNTPTKEHKEEGESGPESEANTPNTLSPAEKEKPILPPLESVKTGEEEETTVAEARVRLYEFVKDSSAWKERCTGALKVNVDQKTNKYRILMRTDNALRVILNALPFNGMKIEKPNATQIKFSCMNVVESKPKLSNFWVKVPTSEDTEKLYSALEKCRISKA